LLRFAENKLFLLTNEKGMDLINAGDMSLAPIGIFIRAQYLSPGTIAHECFHFEEQTKTGAIWYDAYIFELYFRLNINMLDVFDYKFNLNMAYYDAYYNSSP
jgi:hypothetical protein